MLSVKVWCQTDVGLKRLNNEDSFLIDADLGLYLLADGMGGHSGGEVASNMAVQVVRDVIAASYEKESGVNPYDLLNRSYSSASETIYNKSLIENNLKGMGTTLVAALIRDNKIYFANVGDSRAYLVRSTGVWQMTEDHSLVNEQIKAGVIKDEASGALSKNVITRSVGFEKSITCDIIERQMNDGDKYLVCTDGLTGMVNDRDIFEIIRKSEKDICVSELINEAKNNGGLDNVTVMLIDVSSAEG